MDPITFGALSKKMADPDKIAAAVDDWLDDHPEATTTVQDGSITKAKLDANLSGAIDDVSDLKSAISVLPNKVDSSMMQKCAVVDVEASANKWDKDVAQVGMLHTNGNVYTGGSYDNYMYGVKLPVQQGDVIRGYYVDNGTVSSLIISRIAAYKSDGTVVSSSGASDVSTSYTVPNDITDIIVTVGISRNSTAMIIINDDTVPSEYIPYVPENHYYVATDDFIPDELITQYVGGKVDKDGKEQVTAINCDFTSISPNLFNTATVEVGLLNKSTGDLLPQYTNYVTSDWIEIEGSEDYTFSAKASTYLYWCWYNASKEYISGGEKLMSDEPTKQAPVNAKYFRFSLIPASLGNNIQFEKGSSPSIYRPYKSAWIKPECIPPEESNIVFNLPKKVYACVGYECNIYFENLVEDWTKYKWDVSCTKGMQMERGFRITPVAADVGTYGLTFTLTAGNYTETFSTTLVVVGESAGSGVSESIIILGDSTTANSIAVTKLNANLSTDVYNLSTIGTKGTSPNQHEGRSGWRFSTYFSNDEDNAFYNPSTQTFDASYYFTNTGVAKPDWFFINLGINDVFGATSDSSLADSIAQCKEYCDAMIASINEASASTKIGICLTIPPNHSQDAFGKEYKCGQTRNRYKRNNLLWVNALIEEYDGRENEGIYIVPIYAALDTVYNMGLETLPVNARNTAITYDSPIGNGGVHPMESGYWQIADVYTAFLKGNAT